MTNNGKPKYQKLKEYIIDIIKTRQLIPGDKIYSENELADKFGVSRHTVRQAIGDLVGEGWLYRIQGKGTYVDKRTDKKAEDAKTVGVITTYLDDYIFPAIIRGIDCVLSESGYNILLGCTYNQHEKERICLETIKSKKIAGLIVESTKSALPNPNLDFYREFMDSGIPVLFIHGSYRGLNCSYIVEDDELAGYMATKHLIDLGHKRIGGIFKIDDIQGHYRFAGYQKAQSSKGLEMRDSMVLWFNTFEADGILKGHSWDGLVQLISQCSAVVCYNEQIAVRVMDEIRKKALEIPEDISLVTFDDSQLAVASEVKLTTVAHPKEELGMEAGKSMLHMIDGESELFQIKMKPRLVLRQSTKAILE